MSKVELVQLNDVKGLVQNIPSDGNCLFGAVAHQIFRKTVPSVEHNALTRALRELVVEYIGDHITHHGLSELILLRVECEFPSITDIASDVTTIRNFLKVLLQDGIWGASESLLAIAMWFKCDIVIHREKGFTTNIVDDDGSTTTRPKIVLVFRGPRNHWNHYESFLKFTETPPSKPSIPKLNKWWSEVSHKNGTCIALKTNPDGNCLFSSMAHQLFGTEIGSHRHTTNINMLRQQSAHHLESNMHTQRYQTILSDRLIGFPLLCTGNTSQSIQLFINHLAKPNVWGGNECILAISDIYGCDIRTIWENGGTTKIASIKNTTLQTITIVHRRGGTGWNHYDSFLCDTNMNPNANNSTAYTPSGSTAGTIDLTSTVSSPPPSNPSFGISSQNLNSTINVDLGLTAHKNRWPNLRIGTWNLRGCNDRNKRRHMDEYLSIQSFDIVAIQETKLARRTCDTRHYKWVICNNDKPTARGLAFLIHVSMAHLIPKTINISQNIFGCELTNDGQTAIFINVHIPQGNDGTLEFDLLKKFVSRNQQSKLIIFGDFNAQVGSKDLTNMDRKLIGPNLYHDVCNDNGEELKNLLHFGEFSMINTWSNSPSIKTTWSNTNIYSQIDHILCNTQSIKFRRTFGTNILQVSTDHKLISTDIHILQERLTTQTKRSGSPLHQHKNKRRRIHNTTTQWDTKLLGLQEYRDKFQKEMTIATRALIAAESVPTTTELTEPSHLWTKIEKLIKQTASNTIPIQKEILSPKRLAARNSFWNERDRLLKDPSNFDFQNRAQKARRRLSCHIPVIPFYQAGFISNRSTDDHIFTIRRVTEERWRKGLPTYIISLDLKKAFDMVNIQQIINILQSYDTPAFLINRIISAILHENTSIRWFGRRTKIFSKNKGIKQGCPISPLLFVIILNYAIQRACNRIGIDMNLSTFQPPFLLAYADDIIVLTDSIQSASNVIRELEKELLSVGLSINAPKCSVLLRDPVQAVPPLDDSVMINGTKMQVVTIMKYLGIFISSNLDRRSTVAHRIKMAYRTFHMLLPFFQEHRMSFESLMRLYHSVIVPAVIYGLKVSTLTKQNRRSLNRLEYYIVQKLRELARDPPIPTSPIILLKGKTIDRKCRVLSLKFWCHIMRRPSNHILRKSFHFRIPGKYKRGRPCFTWHHSLNRAINRSRIRDWNLHIQNTKKHNELCEEVYLPSDTDESE